MLTTQTDTHAPHLIVKPSTLITDDKPTGQGRTLHVGGGDGTCGCRAREIGYERAAIVTNDRACRTTTGVPFVHLRRLPRESATREGPGKTTRRVGGGVIMVFSPGRFGGRCGNWPGLHTVDWRSAALTRPSVSTFTFTLHMRTCKIRRTAGRRQKQPGETDVH